MTAAELVGALQSLVSRETSPTDSAVVTVARFNTGAFKFYGFGIFRVLAFLGFWGQPILSPYMIKFLELLPKPFGLACLKQRAVCDSCQSGIIQEWHLFRRFARSPDLHRGSQLCYGYQTKYATHHEVQRMKKMLGQRILRRK